LCRDGGGWPVLSFGQEGKKRRGAGPGRKKAKLQGQLAPSPPPKKQATTTIPTTSAVPAHASSSVLLEWGPLEQACLCKTSAPKSCLYVPASFASLLLALISSNLGRRSSASYTVGILLVL
jgi:hypothetical protein